MQYRVRNMIIWTYFVVASASLLSISMPVEVGASFISVPKWYFDFNGNDGTSCKCMVKGNVKFIQTMQWIWNINFRFCLKIAIEARLVSLTGNTIKIKVSFHLTGYAPDSAAGQSRDQNSFLLITSQGSILSFVMWGDSASATKNMYPNKQ